MAPQGTGIPTFKLMVSHQSLGFLSLAIEGRSVKVPNFDGTYVSVPNFFGIHNISFFKFLPDLKYLT